MATGGPISSSMSHYLGELYRLGGRNSHVPPSAVAGELSVSSPAAVRMFGRLEEMDLVTREPYKGVRLTAEGARLALHEIRAHRLSEAFLVRVLDYGWHEAHDLADRLAEIADETFVERMEARAGYPTRCPHGEPIPSKDGVMPVVNDQPLTEMPAGARGSISRVRIRDVERLKYLLEEGLVPETEFTVEAKAPFSGPIRLRLGDREVVVGGEIAQQLYVEQAA